MIITFLSRGLEEVFKRSSGNLQEILKMDMPLIHLNICSVSCTLKSYFGRFGDGECFKIYNLFLKLFKVANIKTWKC